mgnify:CR=1 FL=1
MYYFFLFLFLFFNFSNDDILVCIHHLIDSHSFHHLFTLCPLQDRDNRWERVVTAYDVIVAGKGVAADAKTPLAAVQNAYDNDLSDEFVLPTVIDGYDGMKDGDGVFMANFRSDRAREIMTMIADPHAFGSSHDNEYPELVALMEGKEEGEEEGEEVRFFLDSQ